MKCDKEAAGNVGNFLLPLLKYQSFSLSDSFFYHWSDDHGDDHFYEICRDKRNYTDSKSCFESGICNDAEPYSSEKIAYNCSCDHTNELDQRLMAVVNYQSGNNSHNDKADDVSACRTGQLCRTAGKSGKYRKTYKSKQKIDQIADGSFFPSEKIKRQIDGKIGK